MDMTQGYLTTLSLTGSSFTKVTSVKTRV